jgi:O-antigen ligase
MASPERSSAPRLRQVWARIGLADLPAALGLEEGRRRGIWTPDLAVFALLVFLTIALGRVFSKVHVVPGKPVYVTEVGIVAIAGLALWRVGLRGVWTRVRTFVAVIPLLVFWLAGAIAALRGLHSYGVRMMQPDIGLVEYSIFVPLAAVVLDTRERVVRFLTAVLAGTGVITVIYGFLWSYDSNSRFLQNDPQVAIALYMGVGVLLVLARLGARSPVTPVEFLLTGAALVLITLTTVRTSVLSLAVSLVVLVVLMPRSRRVLALGIAVASLAFSVGGALLIEKALPSSNVDVAPVVPPVPIGKGFVSNDAGTNFFNGTLVRADAARGHYSRQLPLFQPYIAGVTGLRPGKTYTVVFAVKPLTGAMTSGLVGNPTGLQWGQAYWLAAPMNRWQFFRKTLRATATTEALGLEATAGQNGVLFDAVRLLPGRVPGPSGDYVQQKAVVRHGKLAFDDGDTSFVGGTIVGSTAAHGRYSRMLLKDEKLEITALNGLQPGRRYPVVFAVKPLGGKPAGGYVGDPTGLHWGQAYWRTTRSGKWQYFRRTLTATRPSEDLAFVAQSGGSRVLFDVLGVGSGLKIPASWHFRGSAPSQPAGPPPPPPPIAQPKPPPAAAPVNPPPAGPAPTIPTIKSENALTHKFSSVFGGSSSSARNVQWRLAIWGFMLRKTAHDPVFGVGFGRPTNFRWRGTVYDARNISTSDPTYSTPPHNSFVNLLFRTGALGLLSLLALVGVALVRVWRVLTSPLRPFDRAMVIGSTAAFVMAAGTACFSVALEGPYMGMVFWIFLGLMLILPKLLAGSEPGEKAAGTS